MFRLSFFSHRSTTTYIDQFAHCVFYFDITISCGISNYTIAKLMVVCSRFWFISCMQNSLPHTRFNLRTLSASKITFNLSQVFVFLSFFCNIEWIVLCRFAQELIYGGTRAFQSIRWTRNCQSHFKCILLLYCSIFKAFSRKRYESSHFKVFVTVNLFTNIII